MGNKESLEVLKINEEHRVIVDSFAHNQYNKKFNHVKGEDGSYHSYSGFTIIPDSDQIKVNYIYGYGDMGFDDNFIVDINNED